MSVDIAKLNEKIKEESSFVTFAARLKSEKVIVGQSKMVDRLLMGLLSRGHILLEGVPGLAKDAGDFHACEGDRYGFQEDPVYARPASRGPRGHPRI